MLGQLSGRTMQTTFSHFQKRGVKEMRLNLPGSFQPLRVGGENIKEVESFHFLWCIIAKDGSSRSGEFDRETRGGGRKRVNWQQRAVYADRSEFTIEKVVANCLYLFNR